MTVQFLVPILLVTLRACLVESSCAACSTFSQPLGEQAKKEILVEVAKQNLLSKLHLRQRPNISHTVSRETLAQALQRLNIRSDEDSLLEFPEENIQLNDDLGTDQDYEIISFADIDSSQASRTILHFHLNAEKGKQQEINNADVWLYLQTPPEGRVSVAVTTSRSKKQTVKDTVQVEVVRKNWYTVTLPTLSKTALSGEENIYLELECFECQHPPLMNNISDAHRPFLVVKAHNKKTSPRIRRHITECVSDLDMCCRKNFYIDFKEIGWSDWIISPEGYHMNLCEGKCPIHLARVPGIAASSHTAIFSLIKANNMYASLSSCCVPTKRRPLSVLYFDKYNVIVKTDIPDMIVESCGCT
ncbi:inhibin beta C chain-like [Spea bombifrons]|uniref:inhibin beta C chain-like n=1 Tax=Spea bombifrons TaxID=233779 RepID=UPI002349A629|nr:inhibin beta C chain-like [Spea bombifrons]XP_053311702.1 inhibin beta C chain-like [Spea bombifrons]